MEATELVLGFFFFQLWDIAVRILLVGKEIESKTGAGHSNKAWIHVGKERKQRTEQ